GNNLTFAGGSGGVAYAQLGHGGIYANGNHSGLITITQANDLTFSGGSGSGWSAYAQLGHGGYEADGKQSGDIEIGQANDLTFSGGGSYSAYAQLGHGGYEADGSHSGNIDVTLSGDLTLTGQDVTDQYALIGHGDEPGDDDTGHTVSGDVMVKVARDADLTKAFIGHLTDEAPAVGYTSGNTFVGVGRNITSDADSQFNSAPDANSGELRIYVGTAANDLIDTNTSMNGTLHGGSPAPNNQGQYAFGSGPYSPGVSGVGGATVAGEFNYYTLPDLFNYIVGATEAGNIVTALGTGDVTLTYDLNQNTAGGAMDFGALYDVDGGTQFIRVESDILYDSTNDLNLLATGDATFIASVQNSNATGGAVNIVGGWDGATGRAGGAGTTPFDISSFAAEDVTTTMVFGIDTVDYQTGGVYIGDSNQLAGVAVGSRMGETNV
ncbi:MAG: hypothetical protein GY701_22750, partial [Sulfitobacter sp.]|nr:hypothetical protein [Sulfitobacter sp.]